MAAGAAAASAMAGMSHDRHADHRQVQRRDDGDHDRLGLCNDKIR
jgi:hypothetical protein